MPRQSVEDIPQANAEDGDLLKDDNKADYSEQQYKRLKPGLGLEVDLFSTGVADRADHQDGDQQHKERQCERSRLQRTISFSKL